MEKFWTGTPPAACDLCGEPIGKTFIDGKTGIGPWGFMCPTCHAINGVGLGTGKGQKYVKGDDGKWKKIAG